MKGKKAAWIKEKERGGWKMQQLSLIAWRPARKDLQRVARSLRDPINC